ncbi:SRPBCC family protein [Trebonia sp.]|uniref:SRPBCC family protein n=1 Tax=Trebonia sp. TaxID=2767075 RepID=UPI002618F627|nr:SRPBCC family protein [Trebonia sp.]
MAKTQWHKFYATTISAPPGLLFQLLSDMPNYGDWLPGSGQYGATTDVEPYPVRRGTRYHDGKPGEPGKDWWGTVTGFQPPGSLDFRHTIHVSRLRASIDVHIHYSLEPGDGATATQVSRWLVLDITLPVVFRPLRPVITARFDKENLRTIAALKAYAESRSSVGG